MLVKLDRRRLIVLLNNLSSFSINRERAEEFGDHLLRVQAVSYTHLDVYKRQSSLWANS